MDKVADGLFISIDYTGTLENGDVFDSSKGRQPLEVQMGEGQVIPGFESALAGMSLNESKVFTLEPNDAYGERDDKRKYSFQRSELPDHVQVELGQTIGMRSPDGQQFPAVICGLDDAQVTVDLNHPLAGKKLTFDIKVVGISQTPTQRAAGCGCGCDCSEPTQGGGDCGGGTGCGSGCN
jgi:peptidylprolyl isomerase